MISAEDCRRLISGTGHDFLDWVKMKERLDTLWEEFKLPIWITEFDWNGDQTADFGDHSRHAEILDSFYRLTFSHQVGGRDKFY